jgi:hypothetical protein
MGAINMCYSLQMGFMALIIVMVGEKQNHSLKHCWGRGTTTQFHKHNILGLNTMKTSSYHHKIPWIGHKTLSIIK